MRNVLTNVLGAKDQTEVHLQERQLASDDRLLLCTDGLHGTLDDATICALLLEHEDTREAAETLVKVALERGSRDNVTALVADWENE
jgi:protein phosphatase